MDQVNAQEPGLKALTDEQLRGKTGELQKRARGGEALENLLVEAFAVSLAAS